MRQKTASWLAGLVTGAWRRILIAALGASLLSIPVVRDISFEEDVLNLLPRKSQVVRGFSLYMQHFSMEDALVVLLECDDSSRLLEFAERFAARLTAYPILKSIQFRTKVQGEGDNPYRFLFNILSEKEIDRALEKLSRPGLERSVSTLKTLLLAPSLPLDREALTLDPLGLLPPLAKHLSSQGLPVDPSSGYYLSKDREALLMILRPAGSSHVHAFNEKLLRGLKEIEEDIRKEPTDGPAVAVSYTGSYAYALFFARWLKHDLTLLSVISLGGLLILFFLFFLRIVIVPLILIPLAWGILWTLALSGLLLDSLNMISIAFSAIVLGLGIDIGIHFYARFQEEVQNGCVRSAMETVFSNTGRAILTAVTTTAIAFFIFSLSSFRGIAELGIMCGIGMLVNLAAMLLIFPSLLVGAFKLNALQPRARKARRENRLEAFLLRFYMSQGRKVMLGAILAILPLIWFARDVRFERNIRTLEPEDLPPAMVNNRIQEIFGKRGEKLIVMIREGHLEKALRRNDALKVELEGMANEGTILGFDSLAAFLPSMETQRHRLERIKNVDRERIIVDLREILQRQGFRVEPFSPFFDHFKEAGVNILSLDSAVSYGLEGLIGNHLRRDGDDYLIATNVYCAGEREFFEAHRSLSSGRKPWKDTAIITGFPLVEKTFGRIVRKDLFTLSVATVLGLLGILMFHFRGWREIVVVLAPLFFAATCFLTLIAILKIPLNLFNLIVIPLIFGIGVDDHVYILHRYLEDREVDEIARAVLRSGRAVLLTSLTTMVGFGALLFSNFDGLVLLGITAVIGIAINMFTALVIMPCLIIHIIKGGRSKVT